MTIFFKLIAMGNCTCEQRELMKLFKCVIDTGNEVLSAFFDLKVLSLPKYKGNFTNFLEDEKHFLYHQWDKKRTACCACPKIGCSIRRITKMETWIFQKLYQSNGQEIPAHVIRNGGCIMQLCLHTFVTRKIAAHELDITVISFFLRIFANMSASEKLSLEKVGLCRSSICHSWSTKCFPMAELNNMWIDLETNLINLSEVRYQRIVQKQIQAFRKLEIEREEIAELSNHINYIKEVVEDLNHNVTNNHNTLVSACVAKFEKLYIQGSHQIQESVSDQSRAIHQAQEKVVSVVKFEAHDFKESLSKTKDEMMTKMSKLEHTQEELIQKFNQVVFELKYDRSDNNTSTEEMVKECAVLWHLETPSEWNEKDVAEALKDVEKQAKKQDFKIKFVRNGSLIILTTVPYGILHDKVKYEHAIKMFLTRMMDVCNINTDIACRVKATLHILERDEVCIHPMYGVCEDKGTQMSISHEDKWCQVDECPRYQVEEQESEMTFNESYDSNQVFRPYHPAKKNGLSWADTNTEKGQRKSQTVFYPKEEILYQSISSRSSDSTPIFDWGTSKSEPNIYRQVLDNEDSNRQTSDLIKTTKERRFFYDDKPFTSGKPTGLAYQPPKRPLLTLGDPLEEISSLPIASDTTHVRLSRKQLGKISRDKKCSIQ